MTAVEAAAELNVALQTIYYHTPRLRRQGLIGVERIGKRVLLIVPPVDPTWRRNALLDDDALRGLVEYVAGQERVREADVLREFTGRGWRRTTVQHRLRRLAREGILRTEEEGHSRFYLSPHGEASFEAAVADA